MEIENPDPGLRSRIERNMQMGMSADDARAIEAISDDYHERLCQKADENDTTHTNSLVSRTEAPFASSTENTYGLSVQKEVWKTKQGEKTFWKYSLPDVVQIFGMTVDGQIISLYEFQPGVGAEYMHLPGETMEQGETPIEAATRGLREETGYEAGRTTLLSSVLENSGRSDRLIHIVIATDCVKKREGEKGIRTVLLSPREFWGRLMQYFSKNPSSKHGGGNTLKAAVLVFNHLGLLPVTTERKRKVFDWFLRPDE